MNAPILSIEHLSAEANHRIANNLASLSSVVRLQSNSVAREPRTYTAEQVCVMLKEISTRIEVTAKLHKFLAQAESNQGIELNNFLREICGMIASIGQEGSVSIEMECGSRAFTQPSLALPIGFIVAELITNSIKYAHPSGLSVKVSVECSVDEEGTLRVNVDDDGVGFPEDFDPQVDGGLGLKLVRTLAKSIQADLQFDHDCLGVRCVLVRQLVH